MLESERFKIRSTEYFSLFYIVLYQCIQLFCGLFILHTDLIAYVDVVDTVVSNFKKWQNFYLNKNTFNVRQCLNRITLLDLVLYFVSSCNAHEVQMSILYPNKVKTNLQHWSTDTCTFGKYVPRLMIPLTLMDSGSFACL